MASDSMRTLLSVKLAGCFVRGTSVTESGLTVSTDRLSGEIILFFKADSPEERQSLGITGENLKACDYLVFYSKEDNRAEIACFLELKGKKLEVAVKQIINTFRHAKMLVEREVEREQHPFVIWKVCICMQGQAPRNEQKSRDELKEIFGQHVRIKHGVKHYKELGSFLRG